MNLIHLGTTSSAAPGARD